MYPFQRMKALEIDRENSSVSKEQQDDDGDDQVMDDLEDYFDGTQEVYDQEKTSLLLGMIDLDTESYCSSDHSTTTNQDDNKHSRIKSRVPIHTYCWFIFAFLLIMYFVSSTTITISHDETSIDHQNTSSNNNPLFDIPPSIKKDILPTSGEEQEEANTKNDNSVGEYDSVDSTDNAAQYSPWTIYEQEEKQEKQQADEEEEDDDTYSDDNDDGNDDEEIYDETMINKKKDDDKYSNQKMVNDHNIINNKEHEYYEDGYEDVYSNQVQPIDSNNTGHVPDSENPKVVWLLSFPSSGESYTLNNIESLSGTTTGSNYATGFQTIIPIRNEFINGPFLRQPSRPKPDYVLTKTYCVGYCNDCAPMDYIVNNTNAFMKGCTKTFSQSKSTVDVLDGHYYSKNVPVKAVYLIRNPFDNIVSRLHSAIKKKEIAGGLTTEHSAVLMKTRDGFDAWCQYIDSKYELVEMETNLFTDDVKSIFKQLPCHADWFRYIQWHNHASAMLDEMKISTHTLYYEDYTNNYNETWVDLLNFLHLDQIYDPVEFIRDKTYSVYFSKVDIQNALKLVRALATPKSWELIKHYFGKLADDD